MDAKTYKKIQNKIYNEFPSGLNHIVFKDPNIIWKKLAGEYAPKEFDVESALHHLNIKATTQNIVKYRILLQKLHYRKKITKKNFTKEIDKIYTLVNEAKDNIKMSQYGLEQKQPITVNNFKN